VKFTQNQRGTSVVKVPIWRNFPKFKVPDKIPNPHTSANPMDTNRNRRFTTPPDPYFETKTALKVPQKLQTYLCEGLLYVYGFNCTFMVDQFQLYLYDSPTLMKSNNQTDAPTILLVYPNRISSLKISKGTNVTDKVRLEAKRPRQTPRTTSIVPV